MEISNKTYELIGHLSIEFNKLEFFSAYLFNSFKMSTNSGFKIIENKGFPTLLKKMRAYTDEIKLCEDDRNELISLFDQIDSFKEERNAYVHSLISRPDINGKEKAILFLDSIKENKTIEKEINHNDIEKLIKEGRSLGIRTIYATVNIEKLINKTGV